MPTLEDLLTTVPHESLDELPNLPVSQIVFDDRAVQPGSLFVALPGRRFDGHHFIPDAVSRGAVAVVGSASRDELHQQGIEPPAIYVQVADSRLALAQLSAAFYGQPSRFMTVVGVTGTDGKTTTSSLIESILTTAAQSTPQDPGAVGVITTVGARIRGVESDTGFHVTTPDAPDVQRFLAQMRDAGCRYAVVETTSHGLAQARVAGVEYDVAVVTNITHEHLDEHGTRDAYVAAKAKLFRMLFHSPPKPGIPRAAVLNADDAGSYDALRVVIAEEAAQAQFPVAVYSYGIAGQMGDPTLAPYVLATNLVYAPSHTRFDLHWWGGEFSLTSPLIGDFNVYNVLAAATAGLALGLDSTIIQEGVARFPGVVGRMERIDRGQPFLALVDFAHTPVSLERALLTLRPLVGQNEQGRPGQLIAVFGSAGLRDRAKRYLMGEVSGRLADFTVITAEDPRTEDLAAISAEIARGVRASADESRYTIVPDRAEAIQFAVTMAQPGDVVAAFGKGHERSMCFGETEYPWSDQAALAAALERLPGRDDR
ncbi:MAG: UDP-N-acetylmuramoyl-L-alanyl-D-glutamate--2,6-diaminopimelate ligase [Chloroflexi bacterium]|nr:MAG: UDP-N-acetylmuramoyl-L-alanyl-D-glutamate--2,6-diaminopimelate ligase [Chloroflexota bacterium]